MKRFFSLLLAVSLLCSMLPQITLGASAAEAQSAVFISRSDGVWLWPTTYYAVSDWAGCNASPSMNSYCYFCGVQHGLCGANHLTTLGHNGVDIPVSVGTEVYAAASGTLYCTNTDWQSRGITAVVEHPITGTGWSYYSIYQHLQSAITAKNGSAVAAGEVIAWSGNTDGYGTGQAHLHFGIVMGASGQGNALAQAPNSNISAIENCGWITTSGYATGRILPNPALNSPAGTPTYTDGCENNVRTHAGSVMYTRDVEEVAIGEEPAVCSHNYTPVETPASCTENGIREYICSSCGDTYSEPIEALGHDYVGVKTDASCATAGYTTYTCSRCNDSYVEMTNGWSEWSTEYPTGIPESLIEQKTQYSTLEKEYSTSTDDTLEGWTSCGPTYSDWGAVQTTTTKPTESDTLRITNTTQTGWGYYHWCNNYNDSGSWGVDSVDCAGASYYHSYVSGTALPQMAFSDRGGQTAYGGTGSGASPCAYNFYVWFRNTGADVYTYSYQTRSEVNLFYRWSDTWSDWSDEEVTSSEDRQVKTQTVYRYYIGELADHDYSYAVTKEPTATATGVLTGTCAGCFDTTTETLPKLNTTDYTYSQIKAPSYTETGTGRYTWKTTAYGNFNFDVTLEKIVDANAPQYQLISASGLAGTTVEVYVAIKNNPGIISLRNTIIYDASALELVKVEDLGLLTGYTTPAATLQSPYTLRWADSLATANNMANGDLVRLTFKISESALVGDYSVSVAHIESRDVDGAKVEFNAASGDVSVIECVIGDTDGDGEVSDWDAIVLNRYLAGWSVETELLAADVDGDGEISDWDAIVLERYLAGWNIELGK